MKSIIAAAVLASAICVTGASAQQATQHNKATQSSSTSQKKIWRSGDKLLSPKKYNAVSDYKKKGLKSPGDGQKWVRVDGQYLLITVATGAILSVVTSN
ncbi:RcnB family protein [Consotaella aegiceratis]|uniref:RcnB family protein n=1 Tax=Consotaella aegiceratis TaxID=3097961 RepID=UPI002F3EB83A